MAEAAYPGEPANPGMASGDCESKDENKARGGNPGRQVFITVTNPAKQAVLKSLAEIEHRVPDERREQL